MMTRISLDGHSPMRQPAHYAQTFLPDFCEQGNLLRTMLIAELLAIGIAAVDTGPWLARLETLALVSLFVQWVAVVGIALLCLSQRYLARLDDRVAAVLAFALLMAVILAFTLVVDAARDGLALPLTEQPVAAMLLEHAVVGAIVSALALRYFYVTAQWRRQIEAEAEARIQALQARIRPHFLFNSLNTIAELTRTEPAQAEAAVEDLSALFHISLSGRTLVTLDDELAMVASYLRLECQRLGERLRVEWSIDQGVGAIAVPALTLQPLVENAVYHGIAQLPAGGRIRIEAQRSDGGATEVTVRNEVADTSVYASGHRMAQDNVRQRLRLARGERATMTTETRAGEYIVRVHLPEGAA